MLTEQAIVEQVTDSGVWVSTRTLTTCSSCQQQNNCATGVIAKALPGRQQRLFVPTEKLLLTGQQVEIAIESDAVLQSSLLVYGMPLLGFFIGLLAAAAAGGNEGWQVFAGLTLAVLAAAVVWYLERQRQDRLTVTLVRVMMPAEHPVSRHCE